MVLDASEIPAVVVPLITVLLSGLLSLVVSLISTKQLYKSKEKELRRNMTEKVLDLRLQIYPAVFEILGKLNDKQLRLRPVTKEFCSEIQSELTTWKNHKAVFLLSSTAFKAYYKLVDALENSSNDRLTDIEIENIITSKNILSRLLRSDVNLIFEEDDKT